MNYRHAFHAGNHADVLKHLTLVFCLSHLKQKDAPFAVLDTHAGAGLHALDSDEARRSPEWREGIGRLWNWTETPAPVTTYLACIRGLNCDGVLTAYPGSPALIAAALRENDLLIACEKHPEDASALRSRLRGAHNVQVHERDGWEALMALLPPRRPRGLVLIDPPYEEPGELERAARALSAALQRFSHGIHLWWRPLKSESALERVDAEARQAIGSRETLRADLWVDAPKQDGKLVGSSLFLVNPPFGLEAALREALPALAQRLATGESGWRLS